MAFSSLCLIFLSMIMLSKFMLFHLVVVNSLQSSTTTSPTCHDDEISALVQFKQSFVIENFASEYECAYPKMASWKSAGNQTSNFCSWDGVECDEKKSHVIGLDLSSSCLYGSITSNNSLFRLAHLQSLNLADNHFNYSQVPTSIRNFPRLRYLNLSLSIFSGLVPREISQLSKLSSLDLSHNYGMFSNEELLKSLAHNLTRLETLDLSYIDISSTLPNTLAHLSLLTSLHLDGCALFGQFPSRIFKLQNLKVLSVSNNPAFLVNLSSLIEKFDLLKELDVSACNIPEGPIPFSLSNLRHLIHLDLSFNKFNGQIPDWLGNLTQLTHLDLRDNNFHGSIPNSLFNLMYLQSLYLGDNHLSGTLELHMFHKLQKLTSLGVFGNNLEVLIESRFMNATTALPKFKLLRLGWCNIREFPNFLRFQETLQILDLSGNKLQGKVPKWMLNTSTQTPRQIYISHNFLSGFEQSPAVLPWVNLNFLDISFNELTGELSPLICNLTSLQLLDLSNNKLIGMLPQCLGNFSDNLEYLNLGNNLFHGILPQTYTDRCYLRMIDVSHNQLQGKLPRSLANCSQLEFLVLSNNKFNHVFPFWLGILPNLRVLEIRHNTFHGGIGKPKMNFHFPELLILDLSYNNFTGEFPFEYIFSGNAMTGDISRPYMKDADSDNVSLILHDGYYFRCSITITNKCIEINYPKIQDDLAVVDISSNRFEGKIPELIGNLKRLRSLNISNNNLTGCIPSSLGNLALLESLDLSQNKLSGGIPQQLKKISFLAKFNVSHNNLTGPILSGGQFNTFDITSYEGNPELCGDLLPKKCGNPEGTQLPPSTEEENDSGSEIEWDWKFVLAGLGSGSCRRCNHKVE